MLRRFLSSPKKKEGKNMKEKSNELKAILNEIAREENLKRLSKYDFVYLMLFFGCKACNCVIWRGCKYKKLWYNLIKSRKE